jgi:hypothetical protein
MTSRNILIAMTLAFLLLLMLFALREQAMRPSVAQISDGWFSSAHADASSAAFTDWDDTDPPSVPVRCAMCHSYYGFMDYLGVDGSTVGKVDKEAKIGSVLFCNTCHNPATPGYTTVEFPSGVKLSELGPEAACMTCHHGRESTVGVNKVTSGKPLDAPIEKQGFINPHYFPASATQAGALAQGAYQYDGQTYVGRFEHTKTMQTCYQCHDPHSLEIDPRTCSPCHSNVVDNDDLRDVREAKVDYDGDGDVKEGIAAELDDYTGRLYQAIRDYAAGALGAPIVYDESAYPYFFVDTNNDGRTDEQEATNANRYTLWSPRLLRAAYNYQFAHKDPGGFVHNPKYLLQVTYDSLADLGQAVAVDMQGLVRP